MLSVAVLPIFIDLRVLVQSCSDHGHHNGSFPVTGLASFLATKKSQVELASYQLSGIKEGQYRENIDASLGKNFAGMLTLKEPAPQPQHCLMHSIEYLMRKGLLLAVNNASDKELTASHIGRLPLSLILKFPGPHFTTKWKEIQAQIIAALVLIII
ncbi:hypothetical protein ACLOJK_025304 [Asimina triloba]